MSLRRDIHGAFETITPPLGGMPERVVQTVLADNTGRRRKGRMFIRARVPLSLVAVIAIIALVVAVLVGGRVVQDWNALHHTSPAGETYQSQLAQLEAQPMRIPALASRGDCQSGPYNSVGSYGSGPVYGDGGITTSSDWGIYYHNLVYAERNISGPILVRAVDLFTGRPVIFIGNYAAGPVAGTDTVNGQIYEQRVELVVDTSHASKTTASHKFNWPFLAGVPTGWSGATGWQIDGVGFGEVFLAC